MVQDLHSPPFCAKGALVIPVRIGNSRINNSTTRHDVQAAVVSAVMEK